MFKKLSNNGLKCFKVIVQSLFIIPETYIFLIIIPFILSFILNFIHSGQFRAVIVQPIVMTSLLTPAFGMLFLTATVVGDWKESIFIKRMHSMNIGRNTFITMLILSLVLIAIPALAIQIGLNFMYDHLNNGSLLNAFDWMGANYFGFSFIGFIFGYILLILAGISLSILITGWIKRRDIVDVIISVLIILLMLVSDYFFTPQQMAGNMVYQAFGYLSPFKYATWIAMMSSSGVQHNVWNLELITFLDEAPVFTKIWQPILFSLLIDTCMLGLVYLTFKLSFK
jgi:hypothetical protein